MECPHLSNLSRINNPYIKEGLVVTNFECSVCRSKRSPWMCVHCGIINCGRFVNGHALQHYENKQTHHISIDCSELSLFCYICDDYVINDKCYKYFHKLRRIIQGNQKVPMTERRFDPKKSPKVKKASQCNFKKSGLRNLGNTCFMNAVLQSLCNIQSFRKYLKEMPILEKVDNSDGQLNNSLDQSDETMLTKELKKTINQLWEGGKSVISPESLFAVIWKIVPRFRGYQQQDAHEFLRYMLDRLHTELLILTSNCNTVNHKLSINQLFSSTKSTIVTSIFGGILQNEVKCLVCGTESKKHDPFFDLSLDIPQEIYTKESDKCLLTDCLSKFTELEELEDTELYNCPNCKQKQKSTKKFWIRRLPNVLCLHLKRFKWTEYFRSKLDHHIMFPAKDLDMSNYILSNMHETRNSCGSSLYDLAAVIVHHGNGIGSGHYTSYATHEGCWHHFNDSSVTICNEDTVLKSKAYILFYIRRKIKL